MYVTCQRCGNAADVTVLGKNRHKLSFNAIECAHLWDKARQDGQASIGEGCPDLQEQVSRELEKFRR